MRLARVAVALVVSLAAASPAAAQLLTFEDIPDPGNTTANVFLPESYHGYTFGGDQGPCGFVGQCSWFTNRGFWQSQFPLTVSGDVNVWANNAAELTMSRATPFNFVSAYIGGMYGSCGRDTPIMTITGYLAGSLVQSTDRAVTCNAFSQETFNWMNVDMIRISRPNPIASLMLDDILVSDAATTTPEPATVALLGGGLLALGAAVRRRRSES